MVAALSLLIASMASMAPANAAAVPEPPIATPTTVEAGTMVRVATGAAPGEIVLGNLTIVSPTGGGWAAALPCSTKPGTTSSVNYTQGITRAGLTMVAADSSGSICLTSSSTTHMVYDRVGTSTAVTAPAPVRQLDTRTTGRVVPGGTVVRVPTGATPGHTVLGNLTIVSPHGSGWAAAIPCNAKPGTTSSVNYSQGLTRANLTAVPADASGAICLTSSNTTHLVYDRVGTSTAISTPSPTRLLDTRTTGRVVPGGTVVRVPTGATPGHTVFGNLTVVSPHGSGWAAAIPCNAKPGTTSSVNYTSGVTTPNLTAVPADASGAICLTSSNTTHLVYDRVGTSTAISTPSPVRLLDSRTTAPEYASTPEDRIRARAVNDGLGSPQGPIAATPDGGLLAPYTHGTIYWGRSVGTRVVRGAILVRYLAGGGPSSALGTPTTDEVDYAGGRATFFSSGGAIFWRPDTGTNAVMPPDYAPASFPTREPGDATVTLGRGKTFLWWIFGATAPLGDHGPATEASSRNPTNIAPDGRGGYYFTDTTNRRIRHVDADGIVRTIAGTGEVGWTGCAWDVPALQSCLVMPHGITVDPQGRVVYTDPERHVVLRIDFDGIVRRVAGTGSPCLPYTDACGLGGLATQAKLGRTTHVRSTPEGLAISENQPHRVTLVRPDGTLVKLAGTGSAGFSGDEGPATAARLWAPADAIPYRGGWLISDGNNCRIRWIDPAGIIHAFAGYGSDIGQCWESYATATKWGRALTGDIGDGRSALWSRMTVTEFFALDGDDIYVGDFLNSTVRRIRGGTIETVVGTGDVLGSNGDGPMPARSFRFGWLSGLAIDPATRTLLITDSGSGRIVEVPLVDP